MDKKIDIKNNFFDLLAFLFSFVISFFRGVKYFFFGFSKSINKRNIFFDFLDFIFRKWTKYFWEKPSLYKVTSFFGDILNSTFKK